MPWRRIKAQPLARQLLWLLLPALALLSLAGLRATALDVHRAADAAYDRSLLGALKSIDSSVSTESGGLSVELPYRVFEFFELTASGPVHYRVATGDGLVELGSADLPEPPRALADGVPQFYDGSYFGEPVRVVAFARALEQPAAGSASRRLVIQVAESTRSRDEFRQRFVRRAALSSAVFLALALALCIGAVVLVLRPVARISREVLSRAAGDAAPIPTQDVPRDLRPVVDAINHHMRQAHERETQQRMFLDDASHQLRTHLTTLRMQAAYAARQEDPGQVREALDALSAELQRATRSTNQLLSLARSESANLLPEWFSLREVLDEVARQFLPAARERQLDLGLDLAAEAGPLRAWGDPALLREALVNLVANAIAYVPAGAITLSAAQDALGWLVAVEDTGPGLPPTLAEAGGTRFARDATRADAGAGLGLAIAAAIATRHHGTLRLETPESGAGLRAALWWPRPAGREETA
jgi:two-component system sensor histidine kinase TctE